MTRRGWLRAVAAALLVSPTLGFLRPDAYPTKRALFEEVGGSVVMTLSLPALFRRYDHEALASIDSGFDTTLRFVISVWQRGSLRLVAHQEVVVKVRRDPWKKHYVVATGISGRWTKRTFANRDDAIAAAVKLQRVPIVGTADLERGAGAPHYFATVFALRNPLDPPEGGRRGESRGQGRDLEWFGRLVQVLAGERAQAEEVVHVRTNYFYLVVR